jgi:maleate isomerase
LRGGEVRSAQQVPAHRFDVAWSQTVVEHLSGPAPQVGVGIIVPFDFTRDRELWRWAPGDTSLLVARTDPVPMRDNLDMVSALGDPTILAVAARQLRADAIASLLYACTACSFVDGRAGEAAVVQSLSAVTTAAVRTTSGAVLQALSALNVERVALVHPYSAAVGDRLRSYLGESGIQVVAARTVTVALGEAPTVTYAEVADMIRAADTPRAEAVFVSCTGLPTYDLIAPIESELRKPVVTANQAGLWSALHAAGSVPVGAAQQLLTVTPT